MPVCWISLSAANGKRLDNCGCLTEEDEAKVMTAAPELRLPKRIEHGAFRGEPQLVVVLRAAAVMELPGEQVSSVLFVGLEGQAFSEGCLEFCWALPFQRKVANLALFRDDVPSSAVRARL
jgi:hypothetical protein